MICSICCGCVGGCTDCISVEPVGLDILNIVTVITTNYMKQTQRKTLKDLLESLHNTLKNDSLAAWKQNRKNAVVGQDFFNNTVTKLMNIFYFTLSVI